MCVCVCVCVHAHVCVHACMRVCVCVGTREREEVWEVHALTLCNSCVTRREEEGGDREGRETENREGRTR